MRTKGDLAEAFQKLDRVVIPQDFHYLEKINLWVETLNEQITEVTSYVSSHQLAVKTQYDVYIKSSSNKVAAHRILFSIRVKSSGGEIFNHSGYKSESFSDPEELWGYISDLDNLPRAVDYIILLKGK